MLAGQAATLLLLGNANNGHIFKFAEYPIRLDYMSVGRLQNQRTVNDSVHRLFGLPPARGATVRWAGWGDIVSPRSLSSHQQMQ
jgi:hypothetical protein